MKIAVAAVAAIIAIPILIGGVGKAIVSALFGTGGTEPSQAAIAEIPSDYLSLYRAAASVCPGLDWTILAAIGDAESKHGRGSGEGIKDGWSRRISFMLAFMKDRRLSLVSRN